MKFVPDWNSSSFFSATVTLPPGTTLPIIASPANSWKCGTTVSQTIPGTSFDPVFAATRNDMGETTIISGEEMDLTLAVTLNGGGRADDTLSATFDISPLDFSKLGLASDCRVKGSAGSGRFTGFILGPVVE